MHSRAWVANSPCGSRINTQRNGTAGKPVLCQTAVSEMISSARSSPLAYQLAIVIGSQLVPGSSASAEKGWAAAHP